MRECPPGPDAAILDEQSFVRELDREIQRARRGRRRLSILVGQVGSRGQYDFVGHRSTDPLLDRVGQALAGQRRRVDVIASLGRGRFALLLPETGEPGALVVAERLRAAVASLSSEHASTSRLGFGVASFGRHGRSASALLRAAERAAVAAKEPQQDGSMIARESALDESRVPATIGR